MSEAMLFPPALPCRRTIGAQFKPRAYSWLKARCLGLSLVTDSFAILLLPKWKRVLCDYVSVNLWNSLVFQSISVDMSGMQSTSQVGHLSHAPSPSSQQVGTNTEIMIEEQVTKTNSQLRRADMTDQRLSAVPKGAGVGPRSEWPTPPPSLAPSHSFRGSPPVPVPVPLPVVNQTMLNIADSHLLNVEEHGHIEWLMTAGLIQPGEVRNICDALNIPTRERVLSADIVQSATSNPGSVSMMVEEAPAAPTSWTEALPSLDFPAPPTPPVPVPSFPINMPALPPMMSPGGAQRLMSGQPEGTATPPGIALPLADAGSPACSRSSNPCTMVQRSAFAVTELEYRAVIA